VVLLVLEAALLLLLGLFHRIVSSWMPAAVSAWEDLAGSFWFSWVHKLLTDTYSIGGENPVLAALIALLGGLALISASGLYRLRRTAWVAALSIQGVQLTVALVLYLTTKPAYVSTLMASGVLMVVYLNYSEVANIFSSPQHGIERGRRVEPKG
jgi:hypothetical protein